MGCPTLGLAVVADTFSITVMEIVANGVMLIVPGAMEAGLGDALFWARWPSRSSRGLRRSR